MLGSQPVPKTETRRCTSTWRRGSLHRLLRDEQGATAVEYAIIITLTLLIVYSIVEAVGDNLNALNSAITAALGTAGP